MAFQGGINKRKYDRVSFKRSIKCKMPNSEVFVSYLAQDISQGGLCVISNEFVPIGTRVMVKLQFEDNGALCELEGKIAWVRQMPTRSEGFQFGLEFKDQPAFKKWQIAQYVVKSDKSPDFLKKV